MSRGAVRNPDLLHVFATVGAKRALSEKSPDVPAPRAYESQMNQCSSCGLKSISPLSGPCPEHPTERAPSPTVHVLKHGKSLCEMPGVPGEWPDHHLFVSFEDAENASQVNCPDCVAKRDNVHLSVRLNQAGVTLRIRRTADLPEVVTGSLPRGVTLPNTAGDAVEESTGQAAFFDDDIGRWLRIG